MAFDFPLNPPLNTVFTTPNGNTYIFNGEIWQPGGSTGAPSNAFVLKVGDTMTGPLVLPHPPVSGLHASSKQYVDTLIAEQALYQGTWQVAANVPNLDPAVMLPLNAYSWAAQTVDPNIPEIAPATLPGIGGTMIAALDTIKWNEALLIYEHVRGPTAISQMTMGDAPPAGAFHGQVWWDSDSGKQYVWFNDGTSQQWVQISGGGGGGAVGIPDDAPIDTKQYGRRDETWAEIVVQEAPVDTAPYVRKDGAWAADPVPTDAPSDGQFYARKDAAWTLMTSVAIGDTPPATPAQGQLWWNSNDTHLYISYDDGDSIQWVQIGSGGSTATI